MFNTNTWTFLTNHSHVLLCLVKNPSMRMRDIADEVCITERAVQRIIAELAEEHYITRIKNGRCNTYQVNTDRHLRHPLEENRTISELVDLIMQTKTGETDDT
ncbi:MAG: ArsR family transcriptional regulator [Candidatus Riflebacteria bacterium HGW-Riflebacteria-2]|jgi:predicted transcriptional regulator|nr:MAG: ArsR family transcriptional regulator [Candidatus Riflebacteria bacterium HGW-Riflebacteria-2]